MPNVQAPTLSWGIGRIRFPGTEPACRCSARGPEWILANPQGRKLYRVSLSAPERRELQTIGRPRVPIRTDTRPTRTDTEILSEHCRQFNVSVLLVPLGRRRIARGDRLGPSGFKTDNPAPEVHRPAADHRSGPSGFGCNFPAQGLTPAPPLLSLSDSQPYGNRDVKPKPYLTRVLLLSGFVRRGGVVGRSGGPFGSRFVVDMPVPTSRKCHQLQERPL